MFTCAMADEQGIYQSGLCKFDENFQKSFHSTCKELRSLTLINIEFYQRGNCSIYARFYAASCILFERLQAIESVIDELLPHLAQFDLSPEVHANGYRSFVTLVERCCRHLLQLCRHITVNKSSLLFRSSHYCSELEAYVETLSQLWACLHYLQKLISFTTNGNLFLDEDQNLADDILLEVEMLNTDCFYGRCLGFQFSDSMQKILQGIMVAMATFSECYQETSQVVQLASSLLNSGKYVVDQALRARQVVNTTRTADIDFCKAFWSIPDSPVLQQLRSFSYPHVDVNEVILLPTENFELPLEGSTETVTITPPCAHTGPSPVKTRLISATARVGQPQGSPRRRFKSKTANASTVEAPPSPGLLFHCHGGGFVSQSSQSHENYLRHWAKVLDMPIFSVDYSLAPDLPFPRALEECFYAYAWALKNQQKLGWTGERVCFAGDSAGANLVISTALRAVSYDIRVPDGILTAYPVVLIQYTPSPARLLSMIDPLLPVGILTRCLAAYAGIADKFASELAKPIFCNPGNVETWEVIGSKETSQESLTNQTGGYIGDLAKAQSVGIEGDTLDEIKDEEGGDPNEDKGDRADNDCDSISSVETEVVILEKKRRYGDQENADCVSDDFVICDPIEANCDADGNEKPTPKSGSLDKGESCPNDNLNIYTGNLNSESVPNEQQGPLKDDNSRCCNENDKNAPCDRLNNFSASGAFIIEQKSDPTDSTASDCAMNVVRPKLQRRLSSMSDCSCHSIEDDDSDNYVTVSGSDITMSSDITVTSESCAVLPPDGACGVDYSKLGCDDEGDLHLYSGYHGHPRRLSDMSDGSCHSIEEELPSDWLLWEPRQEVMPANHTKPQQAVDSTQRLNHQTSISDNSDSGVHRDSDGCNLGDQDGSHSDTGPSFVLDVSSYTSVPSGSRKNDSSGLSDVDLGFHSNSDLVSCTNVEQGSLSSPVSVNLAGRERLSLDLDLNLHSERPWSTTSRSTGTTPGSTVDDCLDTRSRSRIINSPLVTDVTGTFSFTPKMFSVQRRITQSPIQLFRGLPIVKNPYMSPILAPDKLLKGLPDVHIVACHFDPLLDDSVMFAKKLRGLGKTVDLQVVDNLPHGFLSLSDNSQEAKRAADICLNKIKDVLHV